MKTIIFYIALFAVSYFVMDCIGSKLTFAELWILIK